MSKVLENVSNVFVYWNLMANSDNYVPCKGDEELEDFFFVKLIKKKLEWAGIDIVIPDALSVILSYCAETPAEVQMIMVDILDEVLIANNNSIPRGYVITPTDFSMAFPIRFPITSEFPSVKEDYNNKWDAQKVDGANSYDTPEFWEKYKNI